MPRENLALIASTALVLFMFLDTGIARREGKPCIPSSCGTITNISSPFRLKDDPPWCGDTWYELACENNRTTFTTEYGKFHVEEISYDDQNIRLVDYSLEKDKCSVPRNSFILDEDYSLGLVFYSSHPVSYIYFLKCKVPINSSIYIDASPCIDSSPSPYPYFHYALLNDEGELKPSDFNESCVVEVQVPHLPGRNFNMSTTSIFDIYNELSRGMELSWRYIHFFSINSIIYRILEWWFMILDKYLHLEKFHLFRVTLLCFS